MPDSTVASIAFASIVASGTTLFELALLGLLAPVRREVRFRPGEALRYV